jgi:hypothetical protein
MDKQGILITLARERFGTPESVRESESEVGTGSERRGMECFTCSIMGFFRTPLPPFFNWTF